jgi:hypothetical protein
MAEGCDRENNQYTRTIKLRQSVTIRLSMIRGLAISRKATLANSLNGRLIQQSLGLDGVKPDFSESLALVFINERSIAFVKYICPPKKHDRLRKIAREQVKAEFD